MAGSLEAAAAGTLLDASSPGGRGQGHAQLAAAQGAPRGHGGGVHIPWQDSSEHALTRNQFMGFMYTFFLCFN